MLLWKNIASGDREGKTENVKTLCLFQEWKMMNHRHAHRELPRLHTSENWMYYPSVQRRLESHSRNWNDKNMYPHIKLNQIAKIENKMSTNSINLLFICKSIFKIEWSIKSKRDW